MGFIGNYKINQDDKGRITLPISFRQSLGQSVIISVEFEGSLVIRTLEEFNKWSAFLIEKGNLNANARKLQRLILGSSLEVKLDSKGRILIPKDLANQAKLSSMLQVIGVNNKIEIIDADKWAELLDNKDNRISLEEAAEAVENLGN